jgi:hypothetical protein
MASIPKMDGNKILSKERVTRYYMRQRERVTALRTRQPAPPDATPAATEAKDLPDCSVCLTSPSGALILPCGHTSTCHNCALQLYAYRQRGDHRCPICRTHIEKVLQADCPVKAELSAEGTGQRVFNYFAR